MNNSHLLSYSFSQSYRESSSSTPFFLTHRQPVGIKRVVGSKRVGVPFKCYRSIARGREIAVFLVRYALAALSLHSPDSSSIPTINTPSPSKICLSSRLPCAPSHSSSLASTSAPTFPRLSDPSTLPSPFRPDPNQLTPTNLSNLIALSGSIWTLPLSSCRADVTAIMARFRHVKPGLCGRSSGVWALTAEIYMQVVFWRPHPPIASLPSTH